VTVGASTLPVRGGGRHRRVPGTEEPATEDKTATEPLADDEPSQDRNHKSEEHGGPRGNPRIDEEALRRKQEEARRRGKQKGD
jgi:hypothetical protein